MSASTELIPDRCGMPSLVGIAALFGASAGVALGLVAVGIRRAIGGRAGT